MPELPEVENVARALRLNLLGRRLTGLRVRFAGIFSDPTRRVRREIVGKQLLDVHRHGKYLILNFGREEPAEMAAPALAAADGGVPGYADGDRAVPPGGASIAGKRAAVPPGGASARASVGATSAGAALARDGAPGYAAADTHLMLHLRMTGQLLCLPDYRPDKHVHATFDFDGRPVHYRDMRKFGRFQLVDDAQRPGAIDHVGPDVLEVRFAVWYERIAERRAPIKALLLDQGIAALRAQTFPLPRLYVPTG